MDQLESIARRMQALTPVTYYGRVRAIRAGLISVSGLVGHASVGDRVRISLQSGEVGGEIVGLNQRFADVLPEGYPEGLSIGAEVELLFAPLIAPCDAWVGRIVDPLGRPLDGKPLPQGTDPRPFRCEAPPAVRRKRLGDRLPTGLAVFDTILPLVRGQNRSVRRLGRGQVHPAVQAGSRGAGRCGGHRHDRRARAGAA